MKGLLQLVFGGILLLFTTNLATAQDTPVSWTFDSKKINEEEYEITFIAEIEEGWSLYSNRSDGRVVPTTFLFDENVAVPVGKLDEDGESVVEYDADMDAELVKLKGKTTFKQRVRLNKDTNIIDAKVNFMTCDKEKCLPPQDVYFAIDIAK